MEILCDGRKQWWESREQKLNFSPHRRTYCYKGNSTSKPQKNNELLCSQGLGSEVFVLRVRGFVLREHLEAVGFWNVHRVGLEFVKNSRWRSRRVKRICVPRSFGARNCVLCSWELMMRNDDLRECCISFCLAKPSFGRLFCKYRGNLSTV